MKLREFFEQNGKIEAKNPHNRCSCFTLLQMKRWLVGAILSFLLIAILPTYKLFQGPLIQSYMNLLEIRPVPLQVIPLSDVENSKLENATGVILETRDDGRLVVPRHPPVIQLVLSELKLSEEESSILSVWKYIAPVLARSDCCFPEVKQAMEEAQNYWREFIGERRSERLRRGYHFTGSTTDKTCPYAVSSVNKTLSKETEQQLDIPCGLVIDSSITIVALASGSERDFAIELLGPHLPGEEKPSIILHFNVSLQEDPVRDSAVIIQNSWTKGHGWGDEERCPNFRASLRKVDELEACNAQVGTNHNAISSVTSEKWPLPSPKSRSWFPFKRELPFAATLWVGWEGFHMTVNGKHVTSYEYRQNLKPSLVNTVRLKGNVKAVSILSTGLPTSADISQAELDFLKAPRILPNQNVELFIGVFSTGNNFDRRMAVRRSWMQYEAVRAGKVVVRFFVGQHSNKQVNDEIWREALTYEDIQLMPFVDYYNLITLKTVAICIFGTENIQSKYVMKTDDDTFVRVDEVIRALNSTGRSEGIFYGSIVFDGRPHRDPTDKWYTSTEEWPDDVYPPWAFGPGYIISKDIAQFVAKSHYDGNLKLFKLEDVCMGIWIQEYKKQKHEVIYMNNKKFDNLGCSEGYIIAHYQKPRMMDCLWQKLQEGLGPVCCN